MIKRTEREAAILRPFLELARSLIGEWDGYGLVHEDGRFRGPSPSAYVISTKPENHGVVILLIQRLDMPWRREIRVAPNQSWNESTNGGPIERSGAHFRSEQHAIVKRLFDNIGGSG